MFFVINLQEMSVSVDAWLDEYVKELQKLENVILDLEDVKPGPLKNKEISRLSSLAKTTMSRIEDIKKSYLRDLRLSKIERGDKKRQQDNERDMYQRAEECMIKVQAYEVGVVHVDERKYFDADGKVVLNTDGKNNTDLIVGASLIQDKTEESIARSKDVIATTKEIAAVTNQKLKDQSMQLQDINREADTMAQKLEDARRRVAEFTRRVTGDRFIQIIGGINIIILLVFIFYVVATGKELDTLFEGDRRRLIMLRGNDGY